MTDTHSITELLARAGRGDESAAGQLLPRVYDELRSMASQYLAGERIDHTLQPTALVHEAYLRLAGGDRSFRSRAHFFAASATAMRRILVDHARKRRAAKRGADARRVQLTTEGAATLRQDMHVLEVNDLIEQLGKLHARKARVVELRFFAGMTIKEVAEALGVSTSVIDDDWAVARAWLAAQVQHKGTDA